MYQSPLVQYLVMAESPSSSSSSSSCDDDPYGFNLNLMLLVAAIVCAFLCALGLNTMLYCVFQCAISQPLQWIASRRLNSGLNQKDMLALPTSTYTSSNHSSSSSSSNCAICLADFTDGDPIRFLPKCNHRFHVACIDQWLLSHSSCPTCRHFLKSSHCLHSFHVLVDHT